MTDNPRDELAQQLLGGPYDKLPPLKRSVIDLMVDRTPTGTDPLLARDQRTFWQRLADRVAAVGGSWAFIFGFAVALAAWMSLNLALTPLRLAFDPYPFIFLNLLLSTLAAVQAPVIMMSQNRQASKDRQAAEHDNIVNLRAELEIMRLHDKLDELRGRELAEMLRAQAETLDLLRHEVAALRAAKGRRVRPPAPSGRAG